MGFFHDDGEEPVKVERESNSDANFFYGKGAVAVSLGNGTRPTGRMASKPKGPRSAPGTQKAPRGENYIYPLGAPQHLRKPGPAPFAVHQSMVII